MVWAKELISLDCHTYRTTFAGVALGVIRAFGPFTTVYHLETMIEIVDVR